jgi:hypothetical protein
MRVFKNLNEGFDETGTPDMKYYAFDWDDNILEMPTKIILKDENGNEVPMSTEDFAHYRGKLDSQESFEYDGHTIVGFASNPFRYFRTEGDKNFVIDAMLAKLGPAWPDFVEAINNGSIFSIVTARGHTPSVIKNTVYNFIVSNHKGINSNELVKNLEKYRDLAGYGKMSKKEMIEEYLDLCRFYPVTYGSGSATNPEQGKIDALTEFVNYIKDMSKFIKKRAYLKNDISNNFVPQIGFSDDDLRNLEKVKSHFVDKPDNIIKTISTHGGTKKPY